MRENLGETVDLSVVQPVQSGVLDIEMPSGCHFTAVTRAEVDLVKERIDSYGKDFELTNVSDIADIDTVVQFEVLVQRWNNYISAGEDHNGDPIDVNLFQKQVKDVAASLSTYKKQLGIDRVTRDKTEGEDSVSQYITNLLSRAKQFGVNRENQLGKALELSMELIHLVDLYDNSTPQERVSVAIDSDGILDWIRTVFKPQFMEVDEHFRKNVQRMWIKDQ